MRRDPRTGRAASVKELRGYAADIIGAEIGDLVAARKQYTQAGVHCLTAAARLLRAGGYKTPEIVSAREGE